MVQYFHLFNRGVDKRQIFLDTFDHQRFLDAVRLARLSHSPKLSWLNDQIKIGNFNQLDLEKLEEKFGPPLLDIISYCLMPNHFHFQVIELVEKGVSQFFRKLGTSYAMYFNLKHERTGRLFESKYKSVRITRDEQLIHLSRYIHLNPFFSPQIKISLNRLRTYPWSSLPNFLGIRKQVFCNPMEVISFFKSPEEYWNFLKDSLDKKEALEHNLLLETTSGQSWNRA